MGIQAMDNTGFFTQPDVRNGLLWNIPLKRASGLTIPRKSIIKKDNNPVYTLPPTYLLISLLPPPLLDVKRTIWKGKV